MTQAIFFKLHLTIPLHMNIQASPFYRTMYIRMTASPGVGVKGGYAYFFLKVM